MKKNDSTHIQDFYLDVFPEDVIDELQKDIEEIKKEQQCELDSNNEVIRMIVTKKYNGDFEYAKRFIKSTA